MNKNKFQKMDYMEFGYALKENGNVLLLITIYHAIKVN